MYAAQLIMQYPKVLGITATVGHPSHCRICLFTSPSIRSHILGFQVPTITDLLNPALKPRHWTLIEEVIGYKFDPESPLTLRTLIDLDVFDHAEAIQEVSGQASSESSLEAILKKVMFTVTTVCIIHQYTVALFVL